jgi:enoyl-CoA hydratase/carnithine racemase
MVELEVHGEVRLIRMNDGENRLNRHFLDAFSSALDAVEAVEGPCALVTTGAGKFYSNGLDLDWLASGEADPGFVEQVHGLLRRLLTFDRYTVAAVSGHAFAAGAMLATAHDFVLMRRGRGYWCLPEVDLGLPLTPEMFDVLAAHLPRATLADAALTGRRYTAEDAVVAGIAREAVDEDALLDRAIEIAAEAAGKSREVIRAHKALLAGSQPA